MPTFYADIAKSQFAVRIGGQLTRRRLAYPTLAKSITQTSQTPRFGGNFLVQPRAPVENRFSRMLRRHLAIGSQTRLSTGQNRSSEVR